MVDLEVLKQFGSDNARLKEIFTATAPGPRAKLTPKERKERERAVDLRKSWEERISGRLNEHIVFALTNHQIYSAVDLCWDAPPVAKHIYPLMLLAQGRIDTSACADQLACLGCDK